MKKYFALPIAALLCLLSLAGCKAGISSNIVKQANDALEAREIIKCKVLEGLQKGGAFILYQTETITAFMGDREAEIQEICTFQCYQDAPYLTVDVGIVDLSIHFSIPQETVDYLQGILEG